MDPAVKRFSRLRIDVAKAHQTAESRLDLAARTADGRLWLYPGRGTGLGTRRQLGTGWSGFHDLVGVGDFNRDGFSDLAAVRTADGVLYLYGGTGTGLRPRIILATGFGTQRPVL